MPNRSTKPHSPTTGDPYLDLCRRHPLRPIHHDSELRDATAMIHTLLDQNSLTPDEADYLDVLGDLVQKYESTSLPTPPVSDAEMLRFLMDSQSLNQAQTARASGLAESTISEVLSAQRPLTRDQITTLATVFHVSPAVFLHAPGKPTAVVGLEEQSCSENTPNR